MRYSLVLLLLFIISVLAIPTAIADIEVRVMSYSENLALVSIQSTESQDLTNLKIKLDDNEEQTLVGRLKPQTSIVKPMVIRPGEYTLTILSDQKTKEHPLSLATSVSLTQERATQVVFESREDADNAKGVETQKPLSEEEQALENLIQAKLEEEKRMIEQVKEERPDLALTEEEIQRALNPTQADLTTPQTQPAEASLKGGSQTQSRLTGSDFQVVSKSNLSVSSTAIIALVLIFVALVWYVTKRHEKPKAD